jgi:dephospho-CoA kinase
MTMVAGILGGIGSGKSTVSRLFADLGAHVLDADALAHESLARPEIVAAVRAAFGDEVIGADGVVDRKRLGRIVFDRGDRDGLARLNSIVHPVVTAALNAALAAERARGTNVVILDVPLLLGSPWATECDVLLFVKASEASRRARCRARGWDDDETARREARQPSVEAKEAAADVVIENDGDLEGLRRNAVRLFDEWKRSGNGAANGEDR